MEKCSNYLIQSRNSGRRKMNEFKVVIDLPQSKYIYQSHKDKLDEIIEKNNRIISNFKKSIDRD